MSLSQPDHGFKPCVPARPCIALVRHPKPIPVTWFARLVNALRERDQADVDEARRELRRLGFNVIPIGTPKKGGRACHR